MTAVIKMIGTAAMNNNGFEPGALALLIKAELPENLMKVVQLKESSTEAKILVQDAEGKTYGFYNNIREVCWIVEGDLTVVQYFTDNVLRLKTVVVPQRYLMPLKGDFEPEEEDQHVLLSLQN